MSTGEGSIPTGVITSAGAGSTPLVIIRPQTIQTLGQAPTGAGGRIISAGGTPIRAGTTSTPAGAPGAGYVLRGNQLIRIPAPADSSKSPIKVQLVSASGLVKQQQLVSGSGAARSQTAAGPKMEIGPDGQPKYQVLAPQQNTPQVVVVNSSGATVTKPVTKPAGDATVYYAGGEEGSTITAMQSMTLTGHPVVKKGRSSVGVAGSKKPCNCTKSQCLKLYCECFANGEFCRNCNCTNCHNNLAYENERSKSIKMCLERNPQAFQPKIGMKGRGVARVDTERLHTKGCNCKKSNCLKNYCECYEAKVPCTPRCKCCGCRNTEGDRSHKYRGSSGLHSLANAASLLAGTGHPGDYPMASDSPSADNYEKPDPKKMPWYYLTDDVVEATAVCLLAKAEQLETKGTYNDVEMQGEILKEFGRCLQQIIDSSSG